MALQSQALRGDDKLEAAAVSDAAHIVQGARGEHVRKIQRALIALDGAKIATDGIYGAATAAAVLSYKRKRNIINRSYQTQADSIVGKMTIDSLDNEMLKQEKSVVITTESTRCIFQRPPDRKIIV
jgi:peptidoglycan hydrolase-like protein with peptidoglycan-binding domain